MTIFPPEQPFLFGEVKYRNGGHFGPVAGQHLNIIVLFDGILSANIDGRVQRLRAGECGIFLARDSADFEFPVRSHLIWCETGELIVSEEALQRIAELPPALPSWPRLESLQQLGVELGHGSGDNVENLRNTLGAAVAYEYFHRAGLQQVEKPLPASVLRARRLIDRSFDQPLRLDDIAAAAGVTPSHLVASFRRHLDVTPSRYLWQVRTEKGLHLIMQTNLSIAEIAQRCGFQNQFHFSRYIKKLAGHPPTALRKRRWLQAPSIVKGEPADVAYEAEGSPPSRDA